MSDTGAASPPEAPPAPRPRGRCCLKLALGSLLLCGSLGLYALWAAQAALAAQPLPFEPFAWRPFERTVLRGKLELEELPGRFTGDAADVELSERELNGLLFGEANHTASQKARVLLQGDQLELQVSAPTERSRGESGEPAEFVNFTARLRVSVSPAAASAEVLEGRVGSYELGPLTRPLVARWLTQGLLELRDKNPQLARLKAFWVEEGRARLVYTPR